MMKISQNRFSFRGDITKRGANCEKTCGSQPAPPESPKCKSKGASGSNLLRRAMQFNSMTAIFFNYCRCRIGAFKSRTCTCDTRMSSGTSTVTAPSAPSPDSPPCPPCPQQLSEDAISSFNLELPHLPESSMSPEFAARAVSLRMQFAYASREVQSLMRSMRNAWLQWHLPGPPAAAPGIAFRIFVQSSRACMQFDVTNLVFTPH